MDIKSDTIVTIGRQFGSGGRVVGHRLAERLGINYYDRKILTRAASESGIRGEFFEKMDEKPSQSIFMSFAGMFSAGTTILPGNDYLSGESLFKMQSDAIRSAASEGGCVFVGRCADYVLRDYPDRFDIFVCADMDDRIARAMAYDDKLPPAAARQLIAHTDKTRAAFYNYYTDKVWGEAASYHLCVNSSLLSPEECVDYIINFIERVQHSASK